MHRSLPSGHVFVSVHWTCHLFQHRSFPSVLSLERYDMWLRSNRVKPAKAVVSKRLVPHKFGESSGAAEVALFVLARVLVAIRGGAK